jgi:hypothetical protein
LYGFLVFNSEALCFGCLVGAAPPWYIYLLALQW